MFVCQMSGEQKVGHEAGLLLVLDLLDQIVVGSSYGDLDFKAPPALIFSFTNFSGSVIKVPLRRKKTLFLTGFRYKIVLWALK